MKKQSLSARVKFSTRPVSSRTKQNKCRFRLLTIYLSYSIVWSLWSLEMNERVFIDLHQIGNTVGEGSDEGRRGIGGEGGGGGGSRYL